MLFMIEGVLCTTRLRMRKYKHTWGQKIKMMMNCTKQPIIRPHKRKLLVSQALDPLPFFLGTASSLFIAN